MVEIHRPPHRQTLARFRKLERRLPDLLDDLLACSAHRRGVRPAVPSCAGVYLFSEDGRPLYIGRSRNFNRRLGDHTRPKAAQNSAPFAFNIAKRAAADAGLLITGTRTAIAAQPGFDEHFSSAKTRVRAMEFRFVRVPDPVESTIFEVYAALALGTEGDFNLFETH
jgi:GIY-YIG catalytic domain-containing protein